MLMLLLLSPRNPVNAAKEAIHVELPTFGSGRTLFFAFLASGFGKIQNKTFYLATLLPCPLGTLSNSSTKGTDGCTECPPGFV